MKLHRRTSWTVALVIALFSIPAVADKVVTDFDHSANFSQYHTYSWGHLHVADPLFEQRVHEAVDQALQAKGLQEVEAGGDLTVTAVAVKRNRTEYNTFYDGLGPRWGWHGWGMGMATTTVDKIPVGTLVVDLYDTNSEHLVWRGEAHDQLSDKPEKDTKKLNKSVDKMFERFPPRP
jgi:hypothetical protein